MAEQCDIEKAIWNLGARTGYGYRLHRNLRVSNMEDGKEVCAKRFGCLDNWTPVPQGALDAWRLTHGLTAGELLYIERVFAQDWDCDGLVIWPDSQAAATLGCTVRAVHRYRHKLKKKRIITWKAAGQFNNGGSRIILDINAIKQALAPYNDSPVTQMVPSDTNGTQVEEETAEPPTKDVTEVHDTNCRELHDKSGNTSMTKVVEPPTKIVMPLRSKDDKSLPNEVRNKEIPATQGLSETDIKNAVHLWQTALTTRCGNSSPFSKQYTERWKRYVTNIGIDRMLQALMGLPAFNSPEYLLTNPDGKASFMEMLEVEAADARRLEGEKEWKAPVDADWQEKLLARVPEGQEDDNGKDKNKELQGLMDGARQKITENKEQLQAGLDALDKAAQSG